jgi:hypothetical protein
MKYIKILTFKLNIVIKTTKITQNKSKLIDFNRIQQ